MTLIAGFRGENGGVLLCTDREEGDGYSKRSVDKIVTIDLAQCKVLIAGAGPASIIKKACIGFEAALQQAAGNGANLYLEDLQILERSLEQTYERYVKAPEQEVGLLIVVAFHEFDQEIPPAPRFYSSERAMILPVPFYAAHGSGRLISDYLADRIYKHGMDRVILTSLAAFIFREAASVSSGVGLGTDTVMVYNGDRSFHHISDEAILQLEGGIPSLQQAVLEHWEKHLSVPDWLSETLDPK
jgi:20S proteasome alpha/beta subunit